MTTLHWQDYDDICDQLSIIEKNWLFDKSSLTKRLTYLSHNKFSLEVLSESIKPLREDECQILNISSPRNEWVREVILKGDNIPWVYARSIILSGTTSYNNSLLRYRNIGTNPLGFILFDKEKFDRSDIQITTYLWEILPLSYASSNLWARRSYFRNNRQTILVQEVFLPDFWKQLTDMKNQVL